MRALPSGDTGEVVPVAQIDVQRQQSASLNDFADACCDWGEEYLAAILLGGDWTRAESAYRRMLDTAARLIQGLLDEPRNATYAFIGLIAATEADYYFAESS